MESRLQHDHAPMGQDCGACEDYDSERLQQAYQDGQRDALEEVLELTRQAYSAKSPFANIENINNQMLGVTNQVILNKLAYLEPLKEETNK